jgi:hypothetical protein
VQTRLLATALHDVPDHVLRDAPAPDLALTDIMDIDDDKATSWRERGPGGFLV